MREQVIIFLGILAGKGTTLYNNNGEEVFTVDVPELSDLDLIGTLIGTTTQATREELGAA